MRPMAMSRLPRRHESALAAATHDLRGPLNGIQTWAYVLEHHLQDAPPEVLRALAGIRSSIRDQARLIDALLERPRPTAVAPSRSPAARARGGRTRGAAD